EFRTLRRGQRAVLQGDLGRRQGTRAKPCRRRHADQQPRDRVPDDKGLRDGRRIFPRGDQCDRGRLRPRQSRLRRPPAQSGRPPASNGATCGGGADLSGAIAIGEATLGKAHSLVCDWKKGLANLLRDTRRYEEAERLYRQALADLLKSVGDDHSKVAFAREDFAELLLLTDRLDDALAMASQAVAT